MNLYWEGGGSQLYHTSYILCLRVGDINTRFHGPKLAAAHRFHTVDYRHIFMLSFSAPPFSLFAGFRSPLHQLWLKAQDHTILWIGLALYLIILYVYRYLASPYRKLPPGPRGYPIIGNVLELGKGPWLYFTELQKKYGQFVIYTFLSPLPFLRHVRRLAGDLVYLNAAGQPIIIVNSQKVATDLFDRRAGIYSDRPPLIVACEIMTNGLFFALARYGDV